MKHLGPTILLCCASTCCAAPQVAPANARPVRLVCPPHLPEATLQASALVNGWIVYQSAPLRLNSAAPTRGSPAEHADLASFTTERTGNRRIDTYSLPMPHSGGIWMKCGYGALNEVTLHRQLDDGIRECRITSSSTAGATAIDISCK